VDVLEADGHEVVAISRSQGVDVITRDGLAAALDGVDCIIDTATGPSAEQAAATEFFTTAARNLQDVGSQAGVRRIVVVSIIGTDKFTAGYGAAKLAHEQATLAGPVPARILRAAQFHEFVELLMAWGRQGEVCYLPAMRTQLVAARTVAEALAALAVTPEPASAGAPVPEIAGPREEYLPDIAALLAGRRGDVVKIETVSNPADPDDALNSSGALLPGPHATLAGPTFAEWLDATL
jgi:nucleoside-diphosphate-sugar epimerase